MEMRIVLTTAGVALGAAILLPAAAAAERAREILSFDNRTGGPGDNVVADGYGNLFGTTASGGDGTCFGLGCGTVYELSPPAGTGKRWTYKVLYKFQGGSDGGVVGAQLAVDNAGVVYGYSTYSSPGNVFSLTPPAQDGGQWTFQNLYVFTGGADGSLDTGSAPLIADRGHLYGIAPLGGHAGCFDNYGCGTVFRLDPGAAGAAWSEKTLIEFRGNTSPGAPSWIAGPDSSQGIYVSTAWGRGAVLRLARPTEGNGRVTILSRFPSSGSPGNLVLGTNGDVYGIAGVHAARVFQLAPPASGETRWTRTFIGLAESQGYGAVSLGAGPGGSLIGAVYGDVDFYYGSVFALVPPASGSGRWKYNQIWSFTRGPEYNPQNVVMGGGSQQSNLFGVLSGGDTSGGSVFEISGQE